MVGIGFLLLGALTAARASEPAPVWKQGLNTTSLLPSARLGMAAAALEGGAGLVSTLMRQCSCSRGRLARCRRRAHRERPSLQLFCTVTNACPVTVWLSREAMSLSGVYPAMNDLILPLRSLCMAAARAPAVTPRSETCGPSSSTRLLTNLCAANGNSCPPLTLRQAVACTTP